MGKDTNFIGQLDEKEGFDASVHYGFNHHYSVQGHS